MSNGSTTQTIATVQLPAPSAPSANQNSLLQDVSVYKALRTILNVQTQRTSFGSVATTASDGTPATFSQGGTDSVLIRVFANGSPIAPPGAAMWVAGGGETQVAHGLGRVPLGYIPVRKHMSGVDIYDGDSAWDATYIYFHTTNSASDVIMMIL